MVSVANGVNTLESELEGKTVAEVRRNCTVPLNIDTAAVAHVNGEAVESSYRLEDGDTLEFIKASGQKG